VKLSQADVERLERFLDRVAGETYPEPPTYVHTYLTRQMLDRALPKMPAPAGIDKAKVLDVGCGQGVALELFAQRGFDAIGIALNDEDVAACRTRGFDVRKMDQSFLDFPDGSFDILWCRHCLEHSIFPYFTLSEFRRVLRPQGHLYVEVPAPDTSCGHQNNKNHYSVLGKSMWAALMQRSGYTIVDALDINFTVAAGPDTYWAFIARKDG
jgi:SAM-dependent methyltransferase